MPPTATRLLSVTEGMRLSKESGISICGGEVAKWEERQHAGILREPLPPGVLDWQRYIRRVEQGRRMGGPPEVEALTAGHGYRVMVYRETKSGEGYGEGRPHSAGIMWTNNTVYAVLRGVKREVQGGEAVEEAMRGEATAEEHRGDERHREMAWVGSPTTTAEPGRPKSVASNGSRPGTSGAQTCRRTWQGSIKDQHGRRRGDKRSFKDQGNGRVTGFRLRRWNEAGRTDSRGCCVYLRAHQVVWTGRGCFEEGWLPGWKGGTSPVR